MNKFDIISAFLPLLAGFAMLTSCDKTWYSYTEDERYQNINNITDTPDDGTVNPEEDVYQTVGGIIRLGQVRVVEQSSSVHFRGYWPDGKIIPLKADDGKWILFWGEATSFRTEGTTPWPEDHIDQVTMDNAVFGRDVAGSPIAGFSDGGSWFISIFPQGNPGHLVGFFHAESHWAGDAEGRAHKSIGVAWSDDYGRTWTNPQMIISSDSPKPDQPAWTGLGDGCVIWDETNSRYICYYQGIVPDSANAICMASSSDPEGKPGTWKKWDGSDFTIEACNQETGLGGENVPVAGLASYAGANPSVMWNTFLNKWVMVYATWSNMVYMSFSDDGINWASPVKIIGTSSLTARYPNLISEEGDLTGGEKVKIYWSHDQQANGVRDLAVSNLIFLND